MEKQNNQIIIYRSESGETKIEVKMENETLWLSQKQMAELFGCSSDNIGFHLKNIFKEAELRENSVTENYSITASDNKNYLVKHYNLDAIISVGYRVSSIRGTQFRIWATALIKEYIIKGFAMDDERLKNGRFFGQDYFRELLERVRSIRASERRIYQQITDIFAECSIDYDPKSETTRLFYAHVQDKFHFAITGQTSAEIISRQADSSKPFDATLGQFGRVLQAGHDDHVVAIFPVGRRGHLVAVGELQRVDHAQDFIEVAAGAGGIGDLQAQLLVGVDDEHRAHREVVERIGVDHPVEIAHLLVGVSQDRIVDGGVLGLVDVADPALVALRGIDTQGDGFHVALLPLGAQARHFAQLGGADRGVVRGVGEQHHPAAVSEVVEVDGPQLGVLGEIGNGIAELQGHGRMRDVNRARC